MTNLPCPLEGQSLVSCAVVEVLANPKDTDLFWNGEMLLTRAQVREIENRNRENKEKERNGNGN
jgi:hypothetical protein